ncbi:hypothetical protein F2P81_022353 [Scophthalmus maximus]|uniref:Uncharacterized protein n=1 Tax=Scophthalmus maximus TaxID=52904 RepID=A0A6A4S2C1_SCOMX|nr:hypothetical protein F2P81_022353 [Scophthalmus maximus]
MIPLLAPAAPVSAVCRSPPALCQLNTYRSLREPRQVTGKQLRVHRKLDDFTFKTKPFNIKSQQTLHLFCYF